ncbi:integral membrane protein [Ophiostoma piceae UAMH 11346]|uniref:Integral membrane protein n=1 Tax=Ophiostoma piceae (strain UAMH 11346) TaxID=1262450 RepID=S3C6B1_OPHP1|nr:integral membrane protein [Ophiostoma piceae UAMH 11346]
MSQDPFSYLPRRIANAHHASGPFAFLNPTTRYLEVLATGAAPASATDAATKGKDHIDGAYQIWRSRDNRKGRHAVVLTHDFLRKQRRGGSDGTGDATPSKPISASIPRSSNSVRGVLHGLYKMLVRYPVWDVSYDVAIIFTIGSVVWVINSFFVWLPLAAPWTEFSGEETMAGGVSALVGATIFEVGAVLGLLEAVNENRADCFGWALEEALESGMLSLRPRPDNCQHGHGDRTRLLSRSQKRKKHRQHGNAVAGVGGQTITEANHEDMNGGSSSGSDAEAEAESATPSSQPTSKAALKHRRWTWWPTLHELRTVYAREMGFWGCAIQLFGATIFWISGFTGLPPIYNRLSAAAANGIFWLPQVVGGIGFIVSSVMFMLETQRKWYLPAPKMLGWHIGFWNLVGAIGFTLCGALGFGAAASDAVQYASTLSTFIGSWAFLIGSIIQWYESLDKYTILIQDSLPSHIPQ